MTLHLLPPPENELVVASTTSSPPKLRSRPPMAMTKRDAVMRIEDAMRMIANTPAKSLLDLVSKARALLLTAEKDSEGGPLDPDDLGWALAEDAVRLFSQCRLT